MQYRPKTTLAAAALLSALAGPALADTELTFFYPVAVGGPSVPIGEVVRRRGLLVVSGALFLGLAALYGAVVALLFALLQRIRRDALRFINLPACNSHCCSLFSMSAKNVRTSPNLPVRLRLF